MPVDAVETPDAGQDAGEVQPVAQCLQNRTGLAQTIEGCVEVIRCVLAISPGVKQPGLVPIRERDGPAPPVAGRVPARRNRSRFRGRAGPPPCPEPEKVPGHPSTTRPPFSGRTSPWVESRRRAGGSAWLRRHSITL